VSSEKWGFFHLWDNKNQNFQDSYSLSTLATIVADFGDNLSSKTATIAENVFGDSVDRALNSEKKNPLDWIDQSLRSFRRRDQTHWEVDGRVEGKGKKEDGWKERGGLRHGSIMIDRRHWTEWIQHSILPVVDTGGGGERGGVGCPERHFYRGGTLAISKIFWLSKTLNDFRLANVSPLWKCQKRRYYVLSWLVTTQSIMWFCRNIWCTVINSLVYSTYGGVNFPLAALTAGPPLHITQSTTLSYLLKHYARQQLTSNNHALRSYTGTQ